MSCEVARIFLPDAAATGRLGEWAGRHLSAGQGVALQGELGVGKTCLARGLARGLGVEDPGAVCSPTYLLVMEHPGPVPMLHLDAYLPEKTRAFLADGGLDYLAEKNGVLVVEWAERLAEALPEQTLWVCLTLAEGGGGRHARLQAPAGPDFAWMGEIGDILDAG